jgi:hypothetical protein
MISWPCCFWACHEVPHNAEVHGGTKPDPLWLRSETKEREKERERENILKCIPFSLIRIFKQLNCFLFFSHHYGLTRSLFLIFKKRNLNT